MSQDAFQLDDWRVSTQAKRELVRRLVLEAVSGPVRINILLDREKKRVGFDRLSKHDKNGFNVMASQARAIAVEWQLLDDRIKQRFAAGEMPFSAVYAHLRRAD